VVWLLACLPKDIRVGNDDAVEPYLLFSNSHDGSQAIDVRLTTVRVVCRNTLSFALNGHSARAFRWRHREAPEVVEREVKAFLQPTTAQLREQEKGFRALAARPCDDEAFRRFLTALMPDSAPSAGVNTSGAAAARSFETRRAHIAEARAAVERVRLLGLPDRGIPADAPMRRSGGVP
jgi:hypothetical protein